MKTYQAVSDFYEVEKREFYEAERAHKAAPNDAAKTARYYYLKGRLEGLRLARDLFWQNGEIK